MQPMTDATPAPGAAAASKRQKVAGEPAAQKPEVKRAAETRPVKPQRVRPVPYPMRDFLASHR
jgi:hypothetical protein